MLLGPTLEPLTQPLGALLKGEHEKDLYFKRKRGRYKGIRVQDPSSFRKDPLRSLTCPVYSTDTRETLPGPGFLTSTSPLPFGGVLPLCMGVAAGVFLTW